MICSTIIPTIGRTSLSCAVNSVLQQEVGAEEFEVIVVNDSGKPLLAEDWMESPRVRILHTDRHNRSVARNTGAAVARGQYFHFLDDDDWILPGAFQHLGEQAKIAHQAGWVYGGFRLVNNEGAALKEIHPSEAGNCFVQMLASEWLPLQASWIASRAFFSLGGFAPLNSLEGGYEDIDLSRLVARYYDFTQIPETVAVIRYGDVGSTTDYNNLFKQNRRSREKSLDLPGAYTRLHSSAKGSAYWQGRMAYYYLASVRWNVQQRYFTKAASRMTYLFLSLISAGPSLLSPVFWRAVSQPHFNLVRTTLGKIGEQMYLNTDWKQ